MTRNVRTRALGLAALVALLTATIGFAGSGASATPITTSLAIDCDNLPAEEIYWTPIGETITVELTNCFEYIVFDTFGDVVDTGSGDPATLIVNPTTYIDFYDSSGNFVWDAVFNPIYPQTTPSGQLLLTETLDLPLNALEMNVGSPNRPDLNDDEHFLGGIEDCDLEADDTGIHVYQTFEIEVLKSGEYTFRGVDTDPLSDYLSSLNPESALSDPFLALYTSFDPANPDDNIVGCNDDLNDFYEDYGDDMAEQLPGGRLMEGHQPYFSADLEPGLHTVVLTLYDEVENSDWWQENGPGSVTFEMWGPEGGLCDASDPACQPGPGPGPGPGPAPEPVVVTPKFTG